MGGLEKEHEVEEEEIEVGGRPRSWRMMQFLSGPECSPSWDGALRLRRAAAAAASSRSFSICLLGRPTGFLALPGAIGRTAIGLLGDTRWTPLTLLLPPTTPLHPEYSGCMTVGDLPGAWLEEENDDTVLKEELI